MTLYAFPRKENRSPKNAPKLELSDPAKIQRVQSRKRERGREYKYKESTVQKKINE